MKRNAFKIVATMIFVLMLGIVNITPVQAADGSVTFGSGSYSVSQGETFNIGVHVKGSESILVYEFYLDYNSDSLEYVSGADAGGSGRLKFLGDGNTNSYSYMLSFKAKNPGTSNISISGVFLGPAAGDMKVTSTGSTTVTISGPQSSSGNADLSALSLSPIGGFNFSKEKTEYDITVENNIDKIAVTATPVDSKATVAISDTNLAVGVNNITIKVTAENGAVKNYKIIVRRKDAPQATSSTTPTTVQEIEEAEVAFVVNGSDLFFTKDLKGVELPEGFVESKYTYKGREISLLSNENNNVTLIYLVNGLGKDGNFYVFDEKTDSAYSFIRVENKLNEYSLLKINGNIELPKGYVLSNTSLKELGVSDNETPINLLVAEGETDFFLFYGMNSDGELGFYQYDKKEGTIQRYIVSEFVDTTPVIDGEPSTESPDSVTAMQQELTALKYQNQKDLRNKLIIIIILAFVCLLLIVTVIGLILKLRNKEDDDDDDGDYLPISGKEERKESARSEFNNEEINLVEVKKNQEEVVEFSVNIGEVLEDVLDDQDEDKAEEIKKTQENNQEENLFSGLESHKNVQSEEEIDFLLDFDDDDFTFFDLDDDDLS